MNISNFFKIFFAIISAVGTLTAIYFYGYNSASHKDSNKIQTSARQAPDMLINPALRHITEISALKHQAESEISINGNNIGVIINGDHVGDINQ